jgi:hypothetical protein
MNTTQVIVALLIVLTVISLVALYRNKNLRQKLHLPGITWDFQTSGGTQSEKNRKKKDSQTSEVDLGENNIFEGDVEELAGRDIGSSKTKETDSSDEASSVNFGKGNTFSKKVKKVAGRDINDVD